MDVSQKMTESEDVDEEDRISTLPIHLRETILECLPLKDAMRTCVLSTSWMYSWTGMIKLDLYQMGLDSVEVFHGNIDRILMLHSGPIHTIRLVIPCSGSNMKVDSSDWFHVLSKNGIQEIEIEASDHGDKDFWLPRSLFRCRDIKKLVLKSCELAPPPNFMGFYNLVYLDIHVCKVPSHVLGSLISQSPLLEYLSLKHTCTKYIEESLVVTALNLRTLHFLEAFWGTVIFENVPRLTSVSLLISDLPAVEVESPLTSWDFIYSLPGLTEIVYDTLFCGPVIGKFPRCLPQRFENLKSLTLRGINARVEDDICFVFCLVRSTPVLQDLTIRFDYWSKDALLLEPDMSKGGAQKLLETEARECCTLSNLSTIVLEFVHWSNHEIMLVKIMLSRCPHIKSFRIAPIFSQGTMDVTEQISREFEELPNKDKLVYFECDI